MANMRNIYSFSSAIISPALILFQILGQTLINAASVRLVDGANSCSGTLEVLYDGIWKPVCYTFWDLPDAEVVCRELGCGVVIETNKVAAENSQFGAWLTKVTCTGFESALMDCGKSDWGSYLCVYHAGVICYSKIRLVNGIDSCSGRVEVLQNDTWGTVCDDGWDLSDAAVACREMGCGDAVEVKLGAYFGEGLGQVWMNSLNCSGNELTLRTCSVSSNQNTTPFVLNQCDHKRDAGVICKAVVRLVNGFNQCSGGVEVLHKGIWGTVCDDDWGFPDAEVVCRELGCGPFEFVTYESYFGITSGQMWMDTVDCVGIEPLLSTCPFDGWGDYFCRFADSAGVICNYPVRLVNGSNSCSGRVEVYHDGQWGTVCDDGWDPSDAAVLCRELGCGPYAEPVGGAYFGQGTGAIWMSYVSCVGSESTLIKCNMSRWRPDHCRHAKDAGVICREFDTILQQGGKVLLRIEVKAESEVNPNNVTIMNAVHDEMQKKLKLNNTFFLRWKIQSDGMVFQKVLQKENDVHAEN